MKKVKIAITVSGHSDSKTLIYSPTTAEKIINKYIALGYVDIKTHVNNTGKYVPFFRAEVVLVSTK